MLGGPGVILRGGLCPGRAISHTCVLPVFEFQSCEVLCTNYVSRGLRTDRFGTACESRLTAEAFRPARPRARRHSACGLAIPSFLKRWGSKKFFRDGKCFLTRQTTQLYFRKARRITQSGALPVLQNHVCLCQPRVSLFQLPERLSAQKAKRLFPFVFTKTAKKYTLNFSICNGATAVQ